MTFDDEVIEEAEEYEFFILTQNNASKILNENDFKPEAYQYNPPKIKPVKLIKNKDCFVE